MTANTKMTEYWKKVLEIIPVHLYGTLWTERRNSLHILLKETYQAGRAEMANSIVSILRSHYNESIPCVSCVDEILEEVHSSSQRDGGKK